MLKTVRMLGATVAIYAVVFAASANADDFYRGKSIQFTVGSATGGGYDAYTRTLARFLGKYIPGQPNFTVVNMPAASSLQAVRYLKNVAARDGTQILMFNRNLINLSVMDPKTVDMDFNDFTWIGSMTSDIAVCYVSSASGISSIDDLNTRNVTIGDTSKNGGTYTYSAILRNLFGRTVKQVMGYANTANVWLAIENGEVDGNCTGWTAVRIQRPQWLEQHKINVLLQFAARKHPDLPQVPEVYDLKLTDSQRQAIEFLTLADSMVRPIVAHTAIPGDRATILREAFDKTMDDQDFRAAAAAAKMDLDPMSWKEAADMVRHVTSASEKTLAVAREIVE